MKDKKTGKQPWDQMEGESVTWYERFAKYRMMGKERTVIGVVNQERQLAGKPLARQTPGGWTLISTKFKWTERAEAWELSQVKSTEQLFQEEADKFREDERKVLRLLFIKYAQRAQTLRVDEISADGVAYAMLALVKALEKCYGIEQKIARKGGEAEEDEDTAEGLATFRRLQAQAIATFNQRLATGTDGQVVSNPAATVASTPKKQSTNGNPQVKEIPLFSR